MGDGVWSVGLNLWEGVSSTRGEVGRVGWEVWVTLRVGGTPSGGRNPFGRRRTVLRKRGTQGRNPEEGVQRKGSDRTPGRDREWTATPGAPDPDNTRSGVDNLYVGGVTSLSTGTRRKYTSLFLDPRLVIDLVAVNTSFT